MSKYAVFESTNMGSSRYAERILDAVADTDIENGTFGYLDGLVDGESVIYKFVPGSKDGEPVVVVDQPCWTEDESRITNQRRDKSINEAGTPFRVRVVKVTDEFGITIEGITEDTRTVVKDITDFNEDKVDLTIDPTTGKLVAAKAAGGSAATSGFSAHIMRKRMMGGSLSTPIRDYGYSNVIYEAKVTNLK